MPNMFFSKILLPLAALAGASSASASAAVMPSSPRAFGVVTSIPRGGAGPIDVDTAMKTYAGLCTVQGALDYLSPKTVNKLYNLAVDDADAVSKFAQMYVGGNQAGVDSSTPFAATEKGDNVYERSTHGAELASASISAFISSSS